VAVAAHGVAPPIAFLAGGHDPELFLWTSGQLVGLLDHLRSMMVQKPAYELVLDHFPVAQAEFAAPSRPPLVDATVADQLAGIEYDSGLGTSEESLTPAAWFDGEYPQSTPPVISGRLGGIGIITGGFAAWLKSKASSMPFAQFA
jgi:hypothetical protein